MFNFFAHESSRTGDSFLITGPDYNHIRNVLRMKEGDRFLVSCAGASHLCELASADGCTVTARIVEENCRSTELPISILLFQGLPKGDKMELIVQKCVELGCHCVVPVATKRCVVKLDDKKAKKKIERWQQIAESAAKQAGRGVIPEVQDVMSFKEALKYAKELDVVLIPYELAEGMKETKQIIEGIKPGQSVGIFIGPEGGFEREEVETAIREGAKAITLGKRILRTETAGLTTLSVLMFHLEG